MIHRNGILQALQDALRRSRVVVLTGPRQCGKTTLARQLLSNESPNYFDLEDPVSLTRLEEPMTALQTLQGLVVIDEIQRRPELFPVLRVLVDRPGNPVQFLILGSASGELQRQSSESLAGRIERVSIGGFSLTEVGKESVEDLWHRGSFPLSFLASSEKNSMRWRLEFIQTLLELDLPQWGIRVPAVTLRRFWTMLAHYHGQIWNAAEPARAMGVSEPSIRRYLDVLTDALMVRQLQPWHANLKKRQVRSPKVYVRDSGLLHALHGLDSVKALLEHPKVGASWESFAIEQVLMTQNHDEAFFWATHQGAEIDLILRSGQQLYGVECKRADAPRFTPSMRHAIEDLKLTKIAVIYPGTRRYSMDEQVEVVPLSELQQKNVLFPGND